MPKFKEFVEFDRGIRGPVSGTYPLKNWQSALINTNSIGKCCVYRKNLNLWYALGTGSGIQIASIYAGAGNWETVGGTTTFTASCAIDTGSGFLVGGIAASPSANKLLYSTNWGNSWGSPIVVGASNSNPCTNVSYTPTHVIVTISNLIYRAATPGGPYTLAHTGSNPYSLIKGVASRITPYLSIAVDGSDRYQYTTNGTSWFLPPATSGAPNFIQVEYEPLTQLFYLLGDDNTIWTLHEDGVEPVEWLQDLPTGTTQFAMFGSIPVAYANRELFFNEGGDNVWTRCLTVPSAAPVDIQIARNPDNIPIQMGITYSTAFSANNLFTSQFG